MMKKLLPLMANLALMVSAGNGLCADDSTAQLKPSACVHCHDIENNKELKTPNLAGQNSLYLIKQIKLFRNNTRVHPVLSSTEVRLSNDDIESLAIHYQNLKPENLANKLSKEGESIFSSCTGCHGSNGEGIAPFPRLIGQKPDYIEQQLINFKTGVRQSTVMRAMTINLSDKDIKSLATYLGSAKQNHEVMTGEIPTFDPNN